MKRLIVASLVAFVPLSALSEPCGSYPVDVHVLAKSYPTTGERDHVITTTGDYWVEANNISDNAQSISIVYRHCTQGDPPVCDQGEFVYSVAPHTIWKQQFALHQPRLYPYGQYTMGDEIDVRVDATGKHYRDHDHNFVWAN